MEEKQEDINWKEQYIRICADFDNYRKNKEREYITIKEKVKEDIISHLLPVIDNFKLVIDNEKDIPFGLSSTIEELFRELKNLGFSEFGEVGEIFNPELHNAISLTHEDNISKNTITKIVKKGYKINNNIIRHAEVLVQG